MLVFKLPKAAEVGHVKTAVAYVWKAFYEQIAMVLDREEGQEVGRGTRASEEEGGGPRRRGDLPRALS